MVHIKDVLLGAAFYFIGQYITFIQLNGQFIWDWAKRHPLAMSLFGIPISYIFILAAKYSVQGFDGMMWPQRFIGFATGMIVYAWGVNFYFNQAIDMKTGISLGLSLLLILIQLFWK